MTTSPSDQQHRTLNYVEVIYLTEKGMYSGRKHAHYPEQEANTMFQRTVNKLSADKAKALICLREENHELLKSVKL